MEQRRETQAAARFRAVLAFHAAAKEAPSMKESMVKKPNNCPSFSLCPLGHVETGKQYKPREEKQEQIEGQVTIWE